jgi:hypothetical protein
MRHRSTRILIAASLLLAFTLVVGSAHTVASPLTQTTPTPEHTEGDEHGEEEHGHGERIDAGDASVRIVSPADGATINSNSVMVEIETTNWPLGEGKHWHLYVDGSERGMSQGNSDTMVAADLEPGEHVIEVVLSNERHQELDAADEIVIHINAATTQAASVDNSPLLVGGIVVGVLIVAGVGFALARRK